MQSAISQNAGHEARSAGRVLLAHCSGDPILADQETTDAMEARGLTLQVRERVRAGTQSMQSLDSAMGRMATSAQRTPIATAA